LTAACCPKRDFYTPHPTPPSKENATDFCTALCLLELGTKAQQNSRHKAAKLTHTFLVVCCCHETGLVFTFKQTCMEKLCPLLLKISVKNDEIRQKMQKAKKKIKIC